MAQRLEQIAAELTRSIQVVLSRGLGDPRIRGLISITRVKVSPDLASATVFFSVTPEEHEALTVHGLGDAAPHIRHRVSQMVKLRRMPRLAFKLDHSLKREAAVLDAIRRAVGPAADTADTEDEPEAPAQEART